MIVTKYPDYVQAQLDYLDGKIFEIYAEEMPKERETSAIQDIENLERVKRNIAERIRPLLDEKVRLITNCKPTYIVRL